VPRCDLIENGVLKAFLHNKDTVRQLGAEPTGKARAFTFVEARASFSQPS
jgi:predicted Zn-dependent protease